MSRESTDESNDRDDALGEMMGYDKWPRDVAMDFERARGAASLEYIKDLKGDFLPVVTMFRTLESEFVARVGDNEENIRQVRRIVTEMLFSAARDMNQPFEECWKYWNDLQKLGFYRIERRCDHTWMFAETCREHGQTDLGLSVLDPLIAEVERLRAEPSVTEQAATYYDEELGFMRKLRARLEAVRG